MKVYLAKQDDLWDYALIEESMHNAQEETWWKQDKQRKTTRIKYTAVLNEKGEPVIQKEKEIERPFKWFNFGKDHGEDDYNMWRYVPYSVFYLEFITIANFESFFSKYGLELIKDNEHLILVLE